MERGPPSPTDLEKAPAMRKAPLLPLVSVVVPLILAVSPAPQAPTVAAPAPTGGHKSYTRTPGHQ